ncbi:hypothetical protein [Globicatella sulfidifaciens]|uniref:Uncharacterized protein n=1 Tax=Globicatella sulfidifaciens TaxID=136093 RepID=A0A7X8C5J2_9LACT|nr:hypothetical protein [Globicatella sulfidifaciens]NLJ19385.1 hypothetical protein [Globicatella sulfidifaciens]
MINKSIRLTKEDVFGLNEIINNDPRIEKGQSEALYYCFKDAATVIPEPEWRQVAKAKFESDRDIEISSDEYSNIRTFKIEQNDFDKVSNSIKEQLDMTRPRFSFIARLCILAARMRLRDERTRDEKIARVEIEKVNVDGVALIRKIAELLENTSEDATKKILKIKEILDGKN